MKLRISLNNKLLLFLSIILIIGIIDYRAFLNQSRQYELYDELIYRLNSLRVSFSKIEYRLDMLVVASKERAVSDIIRPDIENLNENMGSILNDTKYKALFKTNAHISEELESISEDWSTVAKNIKKFNRKMTRDEIMLLHNEIDVNIIVVTEKTDRLISFITETVKGLFAASNVLALESISTFILIMFIASLFLYKRIILPAERAALVARRITSGEANAHFQGFSGTAMGKLADELNHMIESFKESKALNQMKNSRLFGGLKVKDSQFGNLNELLSFAGRNLSLNDILNLCVNEAVSAGGADAAAVYFNEDSALRLKASSGFPEIFVKEASFIPHAVLKGMEKNEMTVFFKNPGDYPYDSYGRLLKSAGFDSFMGVPISYNKEILGFLYVAFKNPAINPENNATFFSSIASATALSTGYIDLFQKEYNSKKFLERIMHQIPFGIAVFDKDGLCIMANNVLKNFLGADQKFNFTGQYRIFEDEVFCAQGILTSIRKSYEGYVTEFIINYNPSLIKKYNFIGKPRRFKIKSLPLYDQGGEISEIALLYEDYSELSPLPKVL